MARGVEGVGGGGAIIRGRRLIEGQRKYGLPLSSLRSKRFRLVSEQRKTSVLAAREMKQEPKNESGGRGRGKKETLADKPLDFENLRSPANAAPDWLG